MTKPTVIEVDFCYSFGKTTFRYEQSRLRERSKLTTLNQYSKAELVYLISQMLDYNPDLEMFLEPSQTPVNSMPPSLDQKIIKRQICHAFHQVAGKWGAAYALSLALLDLVRMGDQYVQIQNWPEAIAIYKTIITETLDHHDLVDDHEGDLSTVINRCVTGLHNCFKAPIDPALRQTILDTLARTSSWDVDEHSAKKVID